MKRRFAIIMAALLIAAMAGCSQSGTSSTAEQSTVQSSADSSVAESAESEISEAESSVVSEVTSTESSEEKSETSAAESSENKSKTESSKPKNEESSKKETSKAETSKTETSTPVESSNPSKKPEESSTPSKKPEESSTPSSTPKQEVKATGITLDLSSLSLTSGSTQELNAYILWSNGTSSYNGITWSTSNNGVATVSSSGYVTAKSAGTATITASYGSYSKSCTVTVKAAQQTQPSGGGNGGNGGNGGTQTQPSQPSGGGNSGNGGSGNGGSSGGKSDSSGVTIKFTDNTTVEVGKESSLAIAVYENGSRYNSSNYNISYKSSNTSVATVGSDGFVKGISQGTCTITATYGSSTTTCTVTVKAASGSGSGGGNSQTGNQSSKATEWYSADGNWYCNNIHPNIGDKVTIKYIGKFDEIHGSSYVVRDRTAYAMGIEHGNLYNKTQNALTVSFTVKDPGFFWFFFYKVKTNEIGNIIEDNPFPYDTLRFDVNANETYDEYYYDEFGNRYSTTWVESEHEAFKTQTRKGYTIWECPEMVPIINEYRAKEGKSPLYWYRSEKTKQAFLNNPNLDKIKKWSPEYFNADGSVNWDVYFSEGFGQGCRDNCEYHMDGNPDPHGSNYTSSVAACVFMTNGKYDVRGAVETWMNSSAHRAYIMKLEGSVYICHNGKFFYLS